jgi:uncharacterized protein
MKRTWCIAIGWLVVTTPALPASFDCAGPLAAVERLVCSDKYLSTLDDDLTVAYRRALEVTRDKQALKLSQRTWIKDARGQCADQKCLRLAYRERIRNLQGVVIDVSPDPLADLEGSYLIASPSGCSIPTDNGWEKCAVVDCLSIKRISHNTAYISVVSNQTNGHVCQAEGPAKLAKPGILEINISDDHAKGSAARSLRLDYFADPMTFDGPSDICGARADWSGAEFKKTSRKTRKAVQCTDEGDMDSYLSPKGIR